MKIEAGKGSGGVTESDVIQDEADGQFPKKQ